MALKILILVWSLIVPAAKPSHGDGIPAGTTGPLSCKTSDVSLAGGHALAGGHQDVLLSSPLVPNRDEDESEDHFQTSATVIELAGGIDLALSLYLPVHSAPFAAHFSIWRVPLRC